MVTSVGIVHGSLRPGIVRLGGYVFEVPQDFEVSEGLRGNHGSVASGGVDVVDIDKAVTSVHYREQIGCWNEGKTYNSM
jgi:hypothetical protein